MTLFELLFLAAHSAVLNITLQKISHNNGMRVIFTSFAVIYHFVAFASNSEIVSSFEGEET